MWSPGDSTLSVEYFFNGEGIEHLARELADAGVGGQVLAEDDRVLLGRPGPVRGELEADDALASAAHLAAAHGIAVTEEFVIEGGRATKVVARTLLDLLVPAS